MEKPCPCCGYFPTCGRRSAQPFQPQPIYVWPDWTYRPFAPAIINVAGGNYPTFTVQPINAAAGANPSIYMMVRTDQ